MKKKLKTLAIALVLSLTVLTGCGKPKPTVESLVDDMFDIESQTAEVDIDIECSISAKGLSFDAAAGGDLEMQVSGMNGKGAQTSYIDGKMTSEIQVLDIDEETEFKAYLIVDDGTVKSYSYIDGEYTWYMAESDDDFLDQDTIDKMTETMKDVLKENGELAEDTVEVEDEECYVITAAIEGRDWADILKPMQGMIDDAMEGTGVDIDMLSWFKYCSADITYYISKDTGHLVKTEMDMSDTDLHSMLRQMMKDIGLKETLDEYDNMVDGITFSKFYVSVVLSDVNDTEVDVPDDVIDDAVEMDDSYVIDLLTGGTGDDPNESVDEEYYTLNKCDESGEKLVDVCVSGPWIYDDKHSDDGKDMFLEHKEGGFIYICNQAFEPIYTYAAAYARGESADDSDREYYEEMGFLDYDCDFRVVGTAFYGSKLIFAEESYTYDDGSGAGLDEEYTYLLIAYSDGGFMEFLMIDFYNMDVDDWSDEDFEKLARDLFGN